MNEGWYLMSASDLEIELKRWRDPDADPPRSNAEPLTIEDALAFRDAGNIPDALGRSLRLVLHVNDATELSYLQSKRLAFEPDFHDAPTWRREGSKPVNVVPLRPPMSEEVGAGHGGTIPTSPLSRKNGPSRAWWRG